MMYIEEFRAAAAAEFNTAFSAAYPAVPIEWENQPFEQPNGAPYVSFVVGDAMGREAEIGTGTKVERWSGQLRIIVHVPKDQGSKLGNEIAQVASRIFIRQTLAGVNWHARFTRGVRVNEVQAGEWCVRTLDIAYERDERNSD